MSNGRNQQDAGTNAGTDEGVIDPATGRRVTEADLTYDANNLASMLRYIMAKRVNRMYLAGEHEGEQLFAAGAAEVQRLRAKITKAYGSQQDTSKRAVPLHVIAEAVVRRFDEGASIDELAGMSNGKLIKAARKLMTQGV